jgi:hypothetical protein
MSCATTQALHHLSAKMSVSQTGTSCGILRSCVFLTRVQALDRIESAYEPPMTMLQQVTGSFRFLKLVSLD